MSAFLQDVMQQPQALRDVTAFYTSAEGAALLQREAGSPRLLTGMGASYHAARIAASHLNALGVPAIAVEASDLLFYSHALLRHSNGMVFVSQSGASAEVLPLAAMLGESADLVGVTNHPDSPLAQHATRLFPVHAGTETCPVASLTYSNTLATLWFLARRWGGAWDGTEAETMLQMAEAIESLLRQREALLVPWLERLAGVETLLFLGHGPHEATARQAAMMVSEWVKRPAIGTSIGAFRHGPIEISGPSVGIVLFAGTGRARQSALALAAEVAAHGAHPLVVAGGQLLDADAPTAEAEMDDFLLPLLDLIPAQLFVDGLAEHLGVDSTFRHIGKVVTRL